MELRPGHAVDAVPATGGANRARARFREQTRLAGACDDPSMHAPPYRLGLPAWAYPGWRGEYFDTEPSPLASYASVFDAVEGNTTFHAVPDARTVDGWVRALDSARGQHFRFSFKLPKEVTHAPRPSLETLERFLSVLRPLGERTGPFLLQFPSRVDAAALARFEPVFERVARAGTALVEVRDPALFERPELLNPMLDRHGFSRAMLDSRALYAGDPAHPDVAAALHKKPDLPVLEHDGRELALVRLILHPDPATNAPYLDEWAGRGAALIGEGVELIMMIHCPENGWCPPFAADFHERLRRACEARGTTVPPPLPAWPVPVQGSLL